jgi:hypothetical protein
MTARTTKTSSTQRAAGSSDRTRWFALALIIAAQFITEGREQIAFYMLAALAVALTSVLMLASRAAKPALQLTREAFQLEEA